MMSCKSRRGITFSDRGNQTGSRRDTQGSSVITLYFLKIKQKAKRSIVNKTNAKYHKSAYLGMCTIILSYVC